MQTTITNKKIGILTFHNVTNYGGVLQCYALQEFLKEIGMDVQVINYNSQHIKKANKLINCSGIKQFLKSVILFPLNYKRKLNYNKFIKKNLNLSEKLNSYDELKKYCEQKLDCIIVGSDQVWNSEITTDEKNVYFLEGINKDKISYAASTGDNKSEDINLININYPYFKAVSVREKSTKELLLKLNSSLKINVNIDPVFLLNNKEWHSKITKKSQKNHKYLLLYILNADKKIKPISAMICKSKKINKIYTFSKKKFGIKMAKSIATSGPLEFLNYFYTSSFILTNSFHATVFAIIFKKEFFVILPSKRPERILDILKLFHLEDRIINNVSEVHDKLNEKIDYEKVTKTINQEVDKSRRYLEIINK